MTTTAIQPATPAPRENEYSPASSLMSAGTLVRASVVMQALGIQKTQLYEDVRRGLLPPPIKFSRRMSRFVADEIAAVERALVRGDSPAQRRDLVRRLVAGRALANL